MPLRAIFHWNGQTSLRQSSPSPGPRDRARRSISPTTPRLVRHSQYRVQSREIVPLNGAAYSPQPSPSASHSPAVENRFCRMRSAEIWATSPQPSKIAMRGVKMTLTTLTKEIQIHGPCQAICVPAGVFRVKNRRPPGKTRKQNSAAIAPYQSKLVRSRDARRDIARSSPASSPSSVHCKCAHSWLAVWSKTNDKPSSSSTSEPSTPENV